MEYLFDTANLEDIKNYGEIIPITGVTTNPSIIKAEGKIDFYPHFRKIRDLIGKDKSLHIQVISPDCEGILKDAGAILDKVDTSVYIKVPVTEQGLKAIRHLKNEGISVTATAIYTQMQGYLAMEAGADYIAPYYNRMENMDINPRDIIRGFAQMIEKYSYSTKILAASFKNMGQVNEAFLSGAGAATLSPAIFKQAFQMPAIQKAVENFKSDWEMVFGKDAVL